MADDHDENSPLLDNPPPGRRRRLVLWLSNKIELINAARALFKLWLQQSWPDLAALAVMLPLSLVLYMAPPLPTRSFAVYSQNNTVAYPEFAYPLRKEIVPVVPAILLGPVLPIAMLLALQLRVRSFWDANNAIFGVIYALSSSILFQVFLKWLIGGLRPHFLDVCKPDLTRVAEMSPRAARYNAAGFESMYYTREVCTGDPHQISDSLASFPSGHTTAAFAGCVYVYLYMNGKFKVYANRHAPLWQLVLLNAPILIATLIGGALTIDEFHNWYDIVAGAIIGTVTAFSAYRMCYASIWDWRYNHVPLNRTVPFAYGDEPAMDVSEGAIYPQLDNSRPRARGSEGAAGTKAGPVL